ncbi:restriction endonuclease subunit S, partial [Mycoplasma zalophi]|uniref:restriction endonuclease subunit S n=1 Tax=Mycoplasma zalophi TaxID=191287 RepID=UPI0021C6929F
MENLFHVTNGNILSTSEIKNLPSEQYKYPVFSSKTLNNGLVGYYKEYLFENAIMWSTDGYAGVLNYQRGKFFATGHCGVLLNKERSNLALANCIQKNTRKHVKSGAIPTLKIIDMKAISFFFPNNLKEENKISNFFEKYNASISFVKA